LCKKRTASGATGKFVTIEEFTHRDTEEGDYIPSSA
jgi:hypothetical protein